MAGTELSPGQVEEPQSAPHPLSWDQPPPGPGLGTSASPSRMPPRSAAGRSAARLWVSRNLCPLAGMPWSPLHPPDLQGWCCGEMLLTFADTHGGGEEEEKQEKRGPRQPPTAARSARGNGRRELLLAELRHARGALLCLPAAVRAPAPCPNFLNRSDTWTSITLTHGAHVSRPARPAGLPPPGADPLCIAGDSAPLPALRGPARARDRGRTALTSSPLSSGKKKRVLTSTAMVASSRRAQSGRLPLAEHRGGE